MESFLGTIMPIGFNFAPRGWALCDGQILPINQYQSLYSLLGTTYGGDGRTSFALPDLRGRSIIGFGQSAGLSNISLGEKGGDETRVLTSNNLPPHTHTATVKLGAGVANSAAGTDKNLASNAVADTIFNNAAFDGTMTSGNVNMLNNGSGQGFSIRSPFLGLYICIALQGIFPPRN